MKPLRILISNDDGVFAEGIRTLATSAATRGHEVTVVCPDQRGGCITNNFSVGRHPFGTTAGTGTTVVSQPQTCGKVITAATALVSGAVIW